MSTFIKFDGKKSSDFGLKIINDIEFSSTSYDVETIEVPGRDGVLLKDNQRLKPVKREFPMKITMSRDGKNWSSHGILIISILLHLLSHLTLRNCLGILVR